MQTRLPFLIVVLLMACATQIASDVYTPSLVTIGKTLTGGSLNLAQVSVAIFLFGVSFSQLICGPLSEGLGRKSPLTIGLIIMGIGSVLCALSTSMTELILSRLIQGIGAGALAALWRALFRDVMSGEELARRSSFISIFMIFAASAAPALGGYFEKIGWQSSFVFIALYTIISLIALHLCYQETSQHHHKDRLKFRFIYETYGTLLKSKVFMGTTACTFLAYGGIFSWIVIAPSLLIHSLKVSPIHFGWIMGISGAAGCSVGAYFNGHFVKKIGIPRMMQFGFSLMILAGLIIGIGFYTAGLTLLGVIGPMLLFYFGSTLIWPNAFATAFTPFGHIAGYAGSLYGFMQLVGGAIMGNIVAHLPDNDQRTLAVVITGASALALVIYKGIVMPRPGEKSP